MVRSKVFERVFKSFFVMEIGLIKIAKKLFFFSDIIETDNKGRSRVNIFRVIFITIIIGFGIFKEFTLSLYK
jgi:heme/copper-type cytochrome/quinol oxidase subunit 4